MFSTVSSLELDKHRQAENAEQHKANSLWTSQDHQVILTAYQKICKLLLAPLLAQIERQDLFHKPSSRKLTLLKVCGEKW